jgi:D-alanyl-D-alanine carboxypeptidase
LVAITNPILALLALLLTGAGHAAGHAPATVSHARVSAPASAPAGGRFHFDASPLTPALRRRIVGTSWHPGCPVSLSQLRYLRIGYWGFGHRPHLGEMVVNASAVGPLRHAFGALFAERFPIRRMRLVDDYGGSDYASIQADNTSAFNCRNITGGSGWSMHAYGLAVDINPIENPYVYADGTTAHAASRPYLNRAAVREGMAVAHGTLVRAFDAAGWGWGGRWPGPTDYQHFSANGR